MTHWTELDDNQLRVRLARALGQWFWPNRDHVEDLIAGRNSEPSWTLIDTILNGDRLQVAA